jgi:hypothetical protein
MAIGGLVLTVIGLSFTYYNNRRQTRIYQESLEERVFVRLFASRTFAPTGPYKLNPKGLLGVEVVNLGMRPMYLKRIAARLENTDITFHEHDPLVNEPMKRLEPGEAGEYTAGWDFSEHPVESWSPSDKREDVMVEVETTEKRLSQKVRLDWVSISGELRDLQRK